MSARKGLRLSASTAMFVATFVLLATGLALAASGVATLAGGDEDDGVRARGAQQPLGSLSATPPAPVAPDNSGGGTKGDQDQGGSDDGSGGDAGDGGPGNADDGGPNDGDVRGARSEGGPDGGIGPGGGPAGKVANATAGSDSLPFTGFLAIPVLLSGVGLLVAGAIVRRRAEQQPPA